MINRIPQDFLDRLLGCTDLVEVINSRIPLKRAGNEFVACCPFHDEKTPSFSVSPSKQFYYCFGCGVHGNVIDFLMAYEHLSFTESVIELAGLTGNKFDDYYHNILDVNNSTKQKLLLLNKQAELFYTKQLREHPLRYQAISYLQKRGLNGHTARTFSIGYAPPEIANLNKTLVHQFGATTTLLKLAGLILLDNNGNPRDYFRNRIMFPIRDRQGNTLGFGGRALDDKTTPKYLNSPNNLIFNKGSALYGIYEFEQIRKQVEQLLVVEGYIDVISLYQQGIHYSLAVLGTAATKMHFTSLFRINKNLIICFDGDYAGRHATWRSLDVILPLINDEYQVSFIHLPEGQDPNSLILTEGSMIFKERLLKAIPLPEYIFSTLRVKFDTKTMFGQAKFANAVNNILKNLPSSYFRDLMIEQLKKEIQLHSLRFSSNNLCTTSNFVNNCYLISTPLRKAIALILYRPKIVNSLEYKYLVALREINSSNPGLVLLLQLIEKLKSKPELNIAMLLEHYRGTPNSKVLEKLARWKPEANEQEYFFEEEFKDIINAIIKRSRIDLTNILIKRKTPSTLSPDERLILKQLGK